MKIAIESLMELSRSFAVNVKNGKASISFIEINQRRTVYNTNAKNVHINQLKSLVRVDWL